MTKTVISIGSVTQDIFLEGSIFKPECEEGVCYEHLKLGDKLYADNATFTTGGNASNAAVTFAKQGLGSHLVTAIGDDPAGKAVVDDMQKYGVKTERSEVNDKYNTSLSVVLLAPSGERTILRTEGSTADDLGDPEVIGAIKGDWMYVSSLGSIELLEKVVKAGAKEGMSIAFNPGTKELEHPSKVKELLDNITVLILNKDEGAKLLGHEDSQKTVDDIAKELAEHVDIAFVTDGPKGSVACDGDKIYKAGMYEDVPVIDRTGAGDAFGSGLTSQLARGADIPAALTFASANSTSVVGKIGAKAGILDEHTKIHDMEIEEELV